MKGLPELSWFLVQVYCTPEIERKNTLWLRKKYFRLYYNKVTSCDICLENKKICLELTNDSKAVLKQFP